MDEPSTSPPAPATAPTPTPPIRFEPDAIYPQPALAELLNVTERTIQRWRRRGRGKFPRPFLFMGKPCWRGSALATWTHHKQEEAQS